MNEQQIDANKIIESLIRQVADYAQKVAMLEAYISSLSEVQANEKHSN